MDPDQKEEGGLVWKGRERNVDEDGRAGWGKKKAPSYEGAVVLGDDLLSHRSKQYHRRGRA